MRCCWRFLSPIVLSANPGIQCDNTGTRLPNIFIGLLSGGGSGRSLMLTPWIKKALLKSRFLRLASRLRPSGVAILMYHSVMDDPVTAEPVLGGIVHSTKIFRAQMEIVARDFHPVSMEDVYLSLTAKKTLPERAVAVTFDDGYADNYQAATRILTPLGVPAAFYVTVDSIDNQRLPWPARLRYSFLTSEKESWSEAEGRALVGKTSAGKVWPLGTTQDRNRAFEHASELACQLAGECQDKYITSIEKELDSPIDCSSELFMMTWSELRALACKGHIVGSHTLTHPNLAQISDDQMRVELTGAKHRLEQELSASVTHFSYPCPALQPHWTDRTVTATREIGYKTAVTTNPGAAGRNDDPLCLPRIRPTKTVNDFRWNLECACLRGRR
jgi:peptidoglycan/xylan/chitin deacetylase (PgdA/CDA1 family)